ncbi:hypothetical protein TorRG33x02_072660 [Trema orientale]|uniref:Uncharacterized protein n=1 Tax=Trema orientale TaxID=63057 RepID=A0A2P5FGG9_TREOI|nr:hypothetical protein TorRG33x02_072660 [Trema orientale]
MATSIRLWENQVGPRAQEHDEVVGVHVKDVWDSGTQLQLQIAMSLPPLPKPTPPLLFVTRGNDDGLSLVSMMANQLTRSNDGNHGLILLI